MTCISGPTARVTAPPRGCWYHGRCAPASCRIAATSKSPDSGQKAIRMRPYFSAPSASATLGACCSPYTVGLPPFGILTRASNCGGMKPPTPQARGGSSPKHRCAIAAATFTPLKAGRGIVGPPLLVLANRWAVGFPELVWANFGHPLVLQMGRAGRTRPDDGNGSVRVAGRRPCRNDATPIEADNVERVLADINAHRGNSRLFVLDMDCAPFTDSPSQHYTREGPGHGRTIPLADLCVVESSLVRRKCQRGASKLEEFEACG
jgi:hypothetical protein